MLLKSLSSTPTNDPNRSAFTLIELLSVVAIIGILGTILIPVVGTIREQSGMVRCTGNLRQLGQAALLYATEYNGLAPAASGKNSRVPSYDQIREGYANPPATEVLASYLLGRPANLDVISSEAQGRESEVNICFCPHGDRTPGADGSGESTTASRRYGFVAPANFAGTSPALQRRTFGDGDEANYINMQNIPNPSKAFLFMDYPTGGVAYRRLAGELERVAERHGGDILVVNYDGSVRPWTIPDLLATAESSHRDFNAHWRGL